MENCRGTTQSGKPCAYKGRYEKDSHLYCKTHLPIDECSVCYEPITARNGIQLPCKHTYHTKCLRRWVNSNHATCPYCRSALPDHVIDRLSPAAESATRTFVIDFRGNIEPAQMLDLQRFVMTIVNVITTEAPSVRDSQSLGVPSSSAPPETRSPDHDDRTQ